MGCRTASRSHFWRRWSALVALLAVLAQAAVFALHVHEVVAAGPHCVAAEAFDSGGAAPDDCSGQAGDVAAVCALCLSLHAAVGGPDDFVLAWTPDIAAACPWRAADPGVSGTRAPYRLPARAPPSMV